MSGIHGKVQDEIMYNPCDVLYKFQYVFMLFPHHLLEKNSHGFYAGITRRLVAYCEKTQEIHLFVPAGEPFTLQNFK